MKKVVFIVIFVCVSLCVFAQAGVISADALNAYTFLVDNMGKQVSSNYYFWYDQDGVKYYGSTTFDQYKDGNLDKSTMILLTQQNTVRLLWLSFSLQVGLMLVTGQSPLVLCLILMGGQRSMIPSI